MCELNYKSKREFKVEFFSQLTQEQLDDIVYNCMLLMEYRMNMSGHLRCHVHEIEEHNERDNHIIPS